MATPVVACSNVKSILIIQVFIWHWVATQRKVSNLYICLHLKSEVFFINYFSYTSTHTVFVQIPRSRCFTLLDYFIMRHVRMHTNWTCSSCLPNIIVFIHTSLPENPTHSHTLNPAQEKMQNHMKNGTWCVENLSLFLTDDTMKGSKITI